MICVMYGLASCMFSDKKKTELCVDWCNVWGCPIVTNAPCLQSFVLQVAILTLLPNLGWTSLEDDVETLQVTGTSEATTNTYRCDDHQPSPVLGTTMRYVYSHQKFASNFVKVLLVWAEARAGNFEKVLNMQELKVLKCRISTGMFPKDLYSMCM